MASKHSKINIENTSLQRTNSFDACNATYNSEGFHVNEQGLRVDGALSREAEGTLQTQVHRHDLHILEELGRGASAYVRKARHRGTGDFYVVKCFSLFNEQKRKMLKEEMSIMLELDDASIVKFYGAYLDEDRKVCMVLEYMDRGSVYDLFLHCRRNQILIPECVLAAMTFQILWGLNYLNYQGFMHRDIKPQNLLVNSYGELKVTDFGIGKRTHRHTGPTTDRVYEGKDDIGDEDGCASTFVGTQLYMSPERLKSQSYGYNADVWSLGITLAESMLGHHPLDGHTDNHVDFFMSLSKHETLGELIPDDVAYSTAMIDFVSWCLVVDPTNRAHSRQLLDDGWFDEQLGGSGINQDTLQQAVETVCGWMRQEIPDYDGPNHSLAHITDAGWTEVEDDDSRDRNAGVEVDLNLQTLQSDSDDED